MTAKTFDLSDRERTVLAILIDHYIRTAEPVGSRVLATRYNLGVSPATIRNTLSDLEEIGLVEQPHTSAGRIPTEIGYRLYVDKLLRSKSLSKSDREMIRRELTVDYTAIEDILEQTSRVLANLSSQFALTLSPKFEKGILKKIDCIPLTESKLMVIITVESGFARTILLEVDVQLNQNELLETVEVLNEKLSGLKLGEISQTIVERLSYSSRGNPQLLKLFSDKHEILLNECDEAPLHTEGTINIIAQKEFQDTKKLRDFIGLIEERRTLIQLLEGKRGGDEIIVTIGSELNIDGMEGCAAVTRSYNAGRIRGTVGVIGPTRMEYAKLMSVVDYTAKILTEILSK